MSKPVISVIIPHLNQEDQLHNCLTSLTRQSKNPDPVGFEIIVVDNGSSRLPTAVIAEFSNVLLAEEATPGPGPARNKGVSLSNCNILAFIDADCIAHDAWLETIANVMGKDDAIDIVGGDVRIAIRDENRTTALEAYESVFAYRQENYINKKGFSGTGNLAMRRNIFDSVGPFAGIDIAEDADWGQRATGLGHKIHYIPDMIVYHPARKTFAELTAKWDRHISHSFANYAGRRFGSLRWALLAVAVAGSPIVDIIRVSTSRRLSSFRDRVLASGMLVRIRFYRSVRMITLLFRKERSEGSRNWNRN